MSLGYALTHPILVDVTASANPWRASFDDGVDVVVSVFGAGDLRPYAAAFQTALQDQFEELAAQLAALVATGGPLESLQRLGEGLDEDLDVAGLLRTAGDFLCSLDPAVAAGLLSGLIDDVAAALPVLSPIELVPRIASLADAVLAVLEAPLLSGRDDIEAHRAYRAAAVLRAQLAPLLDSLGGILAGLDVAVLLRGFLADGVTSADLDVAPLRRIGCFLSEQVVPVVEAVFGCAAAFRLDIDIGPPEGPQSMPEGEVTLADDALPAPFPPGLLWAIDLSTNLLALSATIANIAITGNPVRGRRLFQFFADLLIPTWMAFRTLARAVRWDFLNANRFTRFLFGEWGDFCVQFLLRFFGSFSDAFAFSNWISTLALTLMKYHVLTLQPRSIYLYARSLWYLDRWKAEGRPADPGVPVHRYVWLAYTPVMFLSFILGLIYGGALRKYLSVRRLVLPLLVGGLLGLGAMWLALPIYKVGLGDITWPPGTGMLVGGTAAVTLLIGVLLFSQVSEFEDNVGGQAALWVIFAVLAILVIVGAALSAAGKGQGLTDGVNGFVLFGPGAALVAGGLTQVLWWYIVAEGADIDGVFDALDPSTSPYLLPFPSDEDWMCGQDNQGFWSHQAHDGGGFSESFNDDNRYSFDLNHDRGSHCLVSRTGLIVDIRDDQPTGNPNTANRLHIQHLDWADGHDPGWDLERGLTYSKYLHLLERGVRASMGQLVRQGHHVAILDDTGNSAMEHLHYGAMSGQNAVTAPLDPIDLPVVFRDGGRVKSLTFPSSDNTEIDGGATVGRRMALVAAPDGHTHAVALTAADLGADGAIPDQVTLVSDNGTGAPHRHELLLSAEQIGALLAARDFTAVTNSVVAGAAHAHAVSAPGPQPGRRRMAGATVQLDQPPTGRLLAREAQPYDLLGEQLFLRINDRATEWFTWGAHRPSIVGDITLDRAPTPGALIDVNGVAIATGGDRMARSGAADLQISAETQGVALSVRVLPVLVVETRRRGRAARIAVPGVPAGLDLVAVGDGSGDVPDLEVSRAELRDLIASDLVQQAGVPVVAIGGAGASRTFTLDGDPVTDAAGSTPRIEAVLAAVLDAGAINDRDPLPLTAGRLRLNAPAASLEVPITAAPARVVLTDLAAVRLAGADLVAEPLAVTVRGDSQVVTFTADDDSAAGVAQRIATSVEGVRAWAEGSAVVIETVAAGALVSLALAKGGATFPTPSAGSAPALDTGVALADSTAISLRELQALIERGRAEAVRPDAPVTVTQTGGTIRIEAAAGAGTPVAIEGPRDLMAALGVPPVGFQPVTRLEGDGAVELTGLPADVTLPTGGWLEVVVGTDTWRVHLAAEPARAELLLRTLPAAGSTIGLAVDGAAVSVALGADDVASPHAVARRIGAATAGVAVRIAYRLAFEWATHGQIPAGALTLSSTATAPGLLAAGVTSQTISVQGRAAHADVTAVTVLTPSVNRPGSLTRAFTAEVVDAGAPTERVVIASADGGPLAVASPGPDPLGLTPGAVPFPPPPTRSITGAPHDLGASCVAYEIAGGATATVVELNAAPAHLSVRPPAGPLALPDGVDPVLGVITTEPGGAVHRADVSLAGLAAHRDVAARLQQQAPHVVAWSTGGTGLDIDTPGGGTGWRLRLEGRPALLVLGFDSRRIDDAGGIEVAGHGNVVDGAAVSAAEIADIFDTVGALATRDPSLDYTASVSGGTLTVASPRGAVTLRSDPPSLAAELAPGAAGGAAVVSGGPFRLPSGWLLVEAGGAVLGAGLVWGRRAWVESDPVLDSDVDAFTGTLAVTVNGGLPVIVTVDAGMTTLAALVDALTIAVPAAWIGLVTRSDGSVVLRFESRRRGATSSIRVALSAAGLGFAATVTTSPANGPGSGGGSVEDLDAVTLAELAARLLAGRGTTAEPQQAVDASAATGALRLVARGGQGVALGITDPPDGLTVPAPLPGRPDLVDLAYPAPLDTGPDAVELQVTQPPGVLATRTVRAVLRAEPARLGFMALPPSAADLNGRALRITVAGATFTVTFAGVTSVNDAVAQLQRGTGWRVRASAVLVAGAPHLALETLTEGVATSLSVLTDPAVSTVFAVLGVPNPASASGSGDTADVRRVPAADYADVIDRGLLGADPVADASIDLAVEVQRDGGVAPVFQGRRSSRAGCDSSVTVVPAQGAAGSFAAALAAAPAALRLDRSMSRGPAVRAAVALPAFVDASGSPTTRDLSGSLGIRLDDHGAGADVAPAATVTVELDGTFTAAEAAARIDAALSAAGVGHAAAYPDQTIVIETLSAGLAGRVTAPAPDAPGDAAVLDALGLDAAAPLDDRGWAGNGFRGSLTTALADAAWRFEVPLTGGGTQVIDLPVSAGQSAADVAAALGPRLRDPTGTLTPSDGRNRVGLAAVGADGALSIEFFVPGVVFTLAGVPIPPVGPSRSSHRWLGFEPGVDPAFELRPTTTLRTFRMVYIAGQGGREVFCDPAVFAAASVPGGPFERLDVGWVRPPTDAAGIEQAVHRWAPGRWLLSARVAGARSDTVLGGVRTRAYAPAGEMISSGGAATGPDGEPIAFAHRVRYWLALNRSGDVLQPLRVVRVGDELLLDLLILPA